MPIKIPPFMRRRDWLHKKGLTAPEFARITGLKAGTAIDVLYHDFAQPTEKTCAKINKVFTDFPYNTNHIGGYSNAGN